MKTGTRIGFALACCLVLASVWVRGQFGQQAAKLDTVKVRDNLFVIHNDFVPGNVTALVTNSGVLLVDDKFEIDHENILAQLKTITSQPVKYVVNTHHHGDHSGGNAKLQAMNVQVIASEQAGKMMAFANQPGLPDVTFTDRAVVRLGTKEVQLFYFGRAHTSGDVFVYFPSERVIAAGDAFTYGAATPQLVDYAGGGSAKAWPDTLDNALQLDFDTVVPGHGAVTTKAEMKKFRDSTFALKNRVHLMLTQKKSKDEISAVLKSEFNGAQLVFPGLMDGMLVELQ